VSAALTPAGQGARSDRLASCTGHLAASRPRLLWVLSCQPNTARAG